jgi:hypothetical protein
MALSTTISVRRSADTPSSPPRCTPGFSPNPLEGNAPLEVVFTPTPLSVTDFFDSVLWDFDDDGAWDISGHDRPGDQSLITESGLYTVRLRMTNSHTVSWTNGFVDEHIAVHPATAHVSTNGGHVPPFGQLGGRGDRYSELALDVAGDGWRVWVRRYGVYRVTSTVVISNSRPAPKRERPAVTVVDAQYPVSPTASCAFRYRRRGGRLHPHRGRRNHAGRRRLRAHQREGSGTASSSAIR